MSELIAVLSRASDKYGSPYLLGFMEKYHLQGLIEATDDMAREYIRDVGLEFPKKETKIEKCRVF